MEKIIVAALFLMWPCTTMANDFSKRLEACEPYRAQVEAILEEEDIPLYFYFLMVAESTCNQKESLKGAKGFWQMMPPTQRHYGCHDFADLECQTRAAAGYLRRLLALFDGDFSKAVMGYNMGGTNFKRRGATKAAKDLAWTVRKMSENKPCEQ
jgi:membrane-bound lytic murein transglycosylase MltF